MAAQKGRVWQACAGTNRRGEPCRSRVVRADGYCLRHSPDPAAIALAAAASLRGGATTRMARASQKRLHDDELPPLDSPEAAEEWCAIMARAVATGRITAHAGNAAMRAVGQFLVAHDAGRQAAKLKAITDALGEWRRTGNPKPVLKLVEGGRR
jgi:hypothetical protein